MDDDFTEYVGPPDEIRGDSFGSIWVVGAVALIALFTLGGLYAAHYSLKARIDAAAKQATAESGRIEAKLNALQKRLGEMERRLSSPTTLTTPKKHVAAAPVPPAPTTAPAKTRDWVLDPADSKPPAHRSRPRPVKRPSWGKVRLKKNAAKKPTEDSPLFNPYD
jgi:hypothetical protein